MNNRSPVNWEELNWAHLQDDCVARNADRFQRVRNATDAVRFELCRDERQIPGLHRSYPNTFLPRAPDEKSGRTAIVMRSWDIYSYGPEIMAHLRSMLVEAALAASGDYTLFLLVHVRDPERRIHDNATQYQAALDEFVPKELQPIAVLFDGHLLESWYPKIGEHRVELQIFQALQLFAHFYDEFDHYWQLEMDVRYTGDTREYLDSMSRFAREEPRKQSRERASYAYIPEVHGSYRDFFSAVNATLEGGGMWGAEKIKDFAPIGPQPPTKTPQEDNFEWGVGEDADLIVTGQCTDVRMMEDWVYRGWIHNFEDGGDTPRTTCPPAIARASWNLLNAIHTAQFEKGLHLPSEATLPSFAMWHGLKFSYPPQPWYQLPQQDPVAMDKFFNGGKINPDKGGMAYGEAMYNGHWHFDISNTATWWWGSDFPSVIMRSWLGKEPLKKEGQEEDPTKQAVPYILHKDEQGRIWAPNLALHPYKA
ncbi:hypothetical protein MMC25_004134 [Agyrium rufum]|nr:hypothetical protein [Agyrium rufum]